MFFLSKKQKMSRKIRALFYAMVNVVIYNIWHARNRKICHNKEYPANEIFKGIKRQITYSVLHLHLYK